MARRGELFLVNGWPEICSGSDQAAPSNDDQVHRRVDVGETLPHHEQPPRGVFPQHERHRVGRHRLAARSEQPRALAAGLLDLEHQHVGVGGVGAAAREEAAVGADARRVEHAFVAQRGLLRGERDHREQHSSARAPRARWRRRDTLMPSGSRSCARRPRAGSRRRTACPGSSAAAARGTWRAPAPGRRPGRRPRPADRARS